MKKEMRFTKVVGLMSGTSLDGLDLAFCEFGKEGRNWKYDIRCAETIPYSEVWFERLSGLHKASALGFAETDAELGHWMGRSCSDFINRHGIKPDLIASHGHTIFHQPEKHFTSQIGKGAAIAAETGLPVVCDFRSLDVALGGQGAPLVPAGDRLLFAQFRYCLNIGGFANISYEQSGNRIAYDICPANIVLNELASKNGKPFDEDGLMARSGSVSEPLLAELSSLSYYHLPAPKSLGKEWIVENINPLINGTSVSLNDQIRTFTEHIAQEIGKQLTEGRKSNNMLVTGGGAFNRFLIERLRHKTSAEIVIPEPITVNYKEALIFAFLGFLRVNGITNTYQSVTGARKNSSGGAIY